MREGKLEPFQAQPKNQTQELRALCGLRDTLAEVLDLQATSTDDAVFRDAQGDLNRRYDDYRAHYGPISRFATFETGRTDPDTAEPIIGRRNPRLGENISSSCQSPSNSVRPPEVTVKEVFK